ncbi:hypothetical protein Cgig2_018535 [Carnegiea gigantea]|uniref:Uncharacterized protein n=1 Tax=Carnegiea gigantea TaxID=171969 RepID=A0A9Q1KL84_9CARY|nr:hypothetical protein Cgig2_018535 [Carnegiea gigantea]
MHAFANQHTLQDCKDALLPFQRRNLDIKTVSSGKRPSKLPKPQEKIGPLKKDFACKMSDDLLAADLLKGTPFQEKKQKQQQLSSVQWLVKLEQAVTKVLQHLKKALVRSEMTEEDISHLKKELWQGRRKRDTFLAASFSFIPLTKVSHKRRYHIVFTIICSDKLRQQAAMHELLVQAEVIAVLEKFREMNVNDIGFSAVCP